MTNYLRTAVTAEIIAQDSMKWFYRVSGQKHRKPRRHFWTTEMFEYLDTPDTNTKRSKEAIHWTVDILTRMDAYPPCKALKSSSPRPYSKTRCRCDGGGNRHQKHWRLSLKKPTPTSKYPVCEETALGGNISPILTPAFNPNLELTLLEKWFSSELEALPDKDGVRGPDPQTPILEVRAAIRRAFEANPRPQP